MHPETLASCFPPSLFAAVLPGHCFIVITAITPHIILCNDSKLVFSALFTSYPPSVSSMSFTNVLFKYLSFNGIMDFPSMLTWVQVYEFLYLQRMQVRRLGKSDPWSVSAVTRKHPLLCWVSCLTFQRDWLLFNLTWPPSRVCIQTEWHARQLSM